MILHHNLQKAEKFKFENQDIFANAVDKKEKKSHDITGKYGELASLKT